jgi:hypothetical protein
VYNFCASFGLSAARFYIEVAPFQLQFWTMESVKRAKTKPRRENQEFGEWKK